MRWSEKDKHYKDCLNALMLIQISKDIEVSFAKIQCLQSCTLTVDEALDPSAVELRLLSLGCNPSLATGRKRLIIYAYLRLCRSTEELVMLEVEAGNIMKIEKDATHTGMLFQDLVPISSGCQQCLLSGAAWAEPKLLG